MGLYGLCQVQLVLSWSLLVLTSVQGAEWTRITSEDAKFILQGQGEAQPNNGGVKPSIVKPDVSPVDEPMEPIDYHVIDYDGGDDDDDDKDDIKQSASLVKPNNNQENSPTEEPIDSTEDFYYDYDDEEESKPSASLLKPNNNREKSPNEKPIDSTEDLYYDVDEDNAKSFAYLVKPDNNWEKSPTEEPIDSSQDWNYDIDDDTKSSASFVKPHNSREESPTDEPEPIDDFHYDYDDDNKPSVSRVRPDNNRLEAPTEEPIDPTDYPYYDYDDEDDTKSSASLGNSNNNRGKSPTEEPIDSSEDSYYDFDDEDDTKSSASLVKSNNIRGKSPTEEPIDSSEDSYYDYDDDDDTKSSASLVKSNNNQGKSVTEEPIDSTEDSYYDYDDDDTKSFTTTFKPRCNRAKSTTEAPEPFDYSDYDFEDENDTESSVFLVRPDRKPVKSPVDEPMERIDFSLYDFDHRNYTKPSYSMGEGRVNWRLTPRFSEPHDNDLDYETHVKEETLDDPTGFDYECTKDAFKISLFKDQLDRLQVIDLNKVFNVERPSASTGQRNKKTATFLVPFNGCFARQKKNLISLQLLLNGTEVRTANCFSPKSSQNEVSPRGRPLARLDCPFRTRTVSPSPTPTQPPPPSLYPKCSSDISERVQCGPDGYTMRNCRNSGCCWDQNPQANIPCYYPENECTKDGHFVFTIRHDSAAPLLLDPYSLIIPNTNCAPRIVTSTFALFVFALSECGTVHYSLGDTSVTLAEVRTPVETINYRYGVISRDNDIRFLIECRHSYGDNALASTAYMVMTWARPMPSAIFSNGLYGVQLAIAKDNTFTDFYKTYHPPLRMMLGKPLYFQLLLLSPVPDATLIVKYCVAYPRYSKYGATFIYDGCPNPNDSEGTGIFRNVEFNGDRHEKRFWIEVFQFRDADKYIDEDVYFMCSTKIWFQQDGPSPQHCFDA